MVLPAPERGDNGAEFPEVLRSVRMALPPDAAREDSVVQRRYSLDNTGVDGVLSTRLLNETVTHPGAAIHGLADGSRKRNTSALQ